MNRSTLTIEQLTTPVPVSLADKAERVSWGGDWLLGNHRRATWGETVQRRDKVSAQMAADLFIEEGEARFVLLVARVPRWVVAADDPAVEVPADAAHNDAIARAYLYLEKVRARYVAVFKTPCASQLLQEIVQSSATTPYGAGPLPPVPGDGLPVRGSPARPPDPVQLTVVGVSGASEEPPPISRLSATTRGGAILDNRPLK